MTDFSLFRFAAILALPFFLGLAASAAAQEEDAGEAPGVSTATAADEASEGDSNRRRCLFVRSINNYRVLSGNWIVISDHGDDTVLLGEVRPRCFGLRSSFQIGIDTRMPTVCAGDSATLQVDGERCSVWNFEAVESYEAAEALVEARENAEE